MLILFVTRTLGLLWSMPDHVSQMYRFLINTSGTLIVKANELASLSLVCRMLLQASTLDISSQHEQHDRSNMQSMNEQN